MSSWTKPAWARALFTLCLCLGLSHAVLAGDGPSGIGQPVTAAELAAWNIDIRADGKGLPDGSGTVEPGEEIYGEKCAACHGDFGEGVGRVPGLFGGVGSLAEDAPKRRIGSLWPHAPILFDYMRRTMPFGDAQSLTNDELYALTAFILNMNDLWADGDVLDKKNLAKIRMPNRDGFITPDPRPDTTNRRCMRDCAENPAVVSRAELFGNPDN
jgi:S-disulfanyl-L-cysteine oxidoreductase SoxD